MIDASEARTARPPPELSRGDRIGEIEVIASAGDGNFLVREPNGDTAFLAFGQAGWLDDEVGALAVLADDPRFPRVIRRGTDPDRGDYVVLTPPPQAAIRLATTAADRSLDHAVETLEALLVIADQLEAKGLTWVPSAHDLYQTDRAITIEWMRARGSRRLSAGERLDARTMLASVGEAVLPEPAARGGALLVRLLVPARTIASENRTIEEARRDIARARADVIAAGSAHSDLVAICDQGLWRPYNQDAVAIASGVSAVKAGAPWSVLVVCDGVSSSIDSGVIAAGAALATRDQLEHFATSATAPTHSLEHAVLAAIRTAHLVVCADHGKHADDDKPEVAPHDFPGTTIVAAIVYGKRAAIGWIGDSRAWWITDRTATQLTRDHSWVTEVVARGEMSEEDAMQSPEAHTITRCLGPLEVGESVAEAEPDASTLDLREPGVLVLSTDGLWNYAQSADEIAQIVRAAGRGASATTIARLLVACALVRGGQDNVSVAVHVHRG